MKKPAERFKDALLKARTQPYVNKYSVGDVVMNRSYGVISQVLEVAYGKRYNNVNEIVEGPTHYVLKDIRNDKSTVKDISKKGTRWKECEVIDRFYEKVDAHTAKLLYGV